MLTALSRFPMNITTSVLYSNSGDQYFPNGQWATHIAGQYVTVDFDTWELADPGTGMPTMMGNIYQEEINVEK